MKTLVVLFASGERLRFLLSEETASAVLSVFSEVKKDDRRGVAIQQTGIWCIYTANVDAIYIEETR